MSMLTLFLGLGMLGIGCSGRRTSFLLPFGPFVDLRWHPRLGLRGAACLVFSGFSLASAVCLRASCVAPVRGSTYFSLPPQRKVGKRKRLTPPTFLLA